jgi:hypothetical protein
MPFAHIAADENAALRKNVGVRAQLKLDTVQQLGEFVACDIERRLFSGTHCFSGNDGSGSGVSASCTMPHGAPGTSAASVRAMNDAIPRDS